MDKQYLTAGEKAEMTYKILKERKAKRNRKDYMDLIDYKRNLANNINKRLY